MDIQMSDFGEEGMDGADMRKPKKSFWSRMQPSPQTLQKMRPFRWMLVLVCFVIFVIIVSVAINSPPPEGEFTEVKGTKGAVASEDARCSAIGVSMLEKGGSATDAVIAAALCTGVVHAFSSGLGGGGFMLVYNSTNRASTLFDFRETAPAGVNFTLFQVDPELGLTGGLAVGIPGELRGMESAHQKYGVLPWKELFLPSIELAREGFEVTRIMAVKLSHIEEMILSKPVWADIYAPTGTLVKEGDIVKIPTLAATLDTISKEGANAFYQGSLTNTLINEINAAGGNVSASDFSQYHTVHRKPISGFYHGKKILTGGAPTSGPVLLAILNILERYTLQAQGQIVSSYQSIIEAFKFGFGQRTYLGDPEFSPNVTSASATMINKDWAAHVRRLISLTRTYPPSYYGGNFIIQPTPGTTHISVLDSRGQAAAMTSTINLEWGSKLLSSTGILLNNQMDDFSTPGVTNAFGLLPSPANFAAPGKRPLSSSSPTIVLQDDNVALVVGASGGTRIITSTLQTIIGMLDFGLGPMGAISASRMHHQLYPNIIQLENDFSPSLRRGLEDCGHDIELLEAGVYYSAVQAIKNHTDGFIYAASDPRKEGQAAAYGDETDE